MATSENEVQNGQPGTAVAPQASNEVEAIRQRGQLAVARQREINKIARTMEGLEWGSVKGWEMTPHAQNALAEFCYVTRASVQLHIDILGGRPYLNARYWEDLVNAHDHYIGYEQDNVSKKACDVLRAASEDARRQAKQLIADADMLGDAGAEIREQAARFVREAIDLQAKARSFDVLRAHWGAPTDDVSEVYVTRLRRYAPLAPLEEIRAGRIADASAWVQVIEECNWAGARNNDPVGKAEAGKTARTRSFRRAAVKAFSAYLEGRAKEIERAEQVLEAEYEILKSDRIEAAALTSGQQAMSTGAGEPERGRAAEAQPLATREVGRTNPPAPTDTQREHVDATARARQPIDPPAQSNAGGEFNSRAAQQEYFGALKLAGIGDRKAFAAEIGLPDSVTHFTPDDFRRATTVLQQRTHARMTDMVGSLGYESIEEYAASRGMGLPESYKDTQEFIEVLQREVAG